MTAEDLGAAARSATARLHDMVRGAAEQLRDIAGAYWDRYEHTDDNRARARGEGVGELADDLLSLTGVTEQADPPAPPEPTPAGMTTRLFCPLPRCTWFHDDRGPDITRPPASTVAPPGIPTLSDYINAVIAAHAGENENIVRAHMESHDLIEWVRAVVELRADQPSPMYRFPTGAPDSLITPWPTADVFDAAALREFRVAALEPARLTFAHIGTCGFSGIGPARRLDLIASTATAHVAGCDGTGPYLYVSDPDPWAAS